MSAQFNSVLLVCCLALLTAVSHAEQKQSTFTFQSNVDVVLLPVVVRDRQGVAIGDLTEQDFRVWDNNKRQVISGFMLATTAPQPFSQNGSGTGPQNPKTFPSRFVVLLFDDLHITF